MDLNCIIAISGQQHESVYLYGVSQLSNLDSSKTLIENLGNGLSRSITLIWIDSKITEECFETALRGIQCDLTSS